MNFCNKCGDVIEKDEKYCNKCGNYLGNINNQNYEPNSGIYQTSDNKKAVLIGIGIGTFLLFIVIFCSFILKNLKGNYYFNKNSYENNEKSSTTIESKKSGKYSTVIIYDNTYSGVKISKDTDALNLIIEDSVSQKKNCPTEIKKIEDDIISKYGITAVNLCELDLGFARELENVFKKIYNEYPSVRGYITNLTLVNASLSEGYIAAFMPIFNFATSSSSSTYPWVIKTQILLNTSYFLNLERLESSVIAGSTSGHFPKNATIYSPVAHELGHYLSFLAMMRSYKLNSILLVDNNNINTFYNLYSDFGTGKYSLSMIEQAYQKYKSDTNTNLSLDEWRGTISKYALAKNNSGEYIYDETIAESFHDVYLNGKNAKDASKYVVNVLKERLKG